MTDRETQPPRGATGHRPAGGPAGNDPLSLLGCTLLLFSATAAVFLTGGSSQGSLGIFLAGAGTALVFCRPRMAVDWRLWAAGGALTLCASLAFLPARWFGVPGWRKTLETTPGIHLPATVSLVPQESAFWLALLSLSTLIGLFVLAHPVRSRALLVLATAAVLVCGIYAALAIYAKQTGWHYPFDGGATFGFFPNRNHTATFLVTGSILAMGILGVTLRDARWGISLVAAAGLAICVTALFFFSASRGGIVFLLAGTLLWVAGLGATHRDIRLLVSVGALTLACGVLFLFSGSEVRGRLLHSFEPEPAGLSQKVTVKPSASPGEDQPAGNPQDTPFDFRVLIYRDTLRLIRDFPVTGTGLGGFAANFAQYRQASLADSTAIHPESDWLMLAAEAGIPALLCVVLTGWLAVRRLPAWRHHPFWPLRWGCVAAASAAVLHGMVDVPAHRAALGWWILLLAGLGLQLSPRAGRKRSRVQHLLFILGGFGSLFLGIQMIRAQWFGAHPLPPYQAAGAQEEITALYNRQDKEGAMNRARQAVQESPLSGRLYYQLGALLLYFEDTDAEVDQLFRVQRLLNPTWPRIPEQQGLAWISVDPSRTGTLWADALQRRRSIDRVAGTAGDGSTGALSGMMELAQGYPAAQEALFEPASQTPAHALAWLEGATAKVALEHFERLSDRPGFLGSLTDAQRQHFLLLWYSKGDRAGLARFVDDHPDWQTAAWPIHVRQLTDARRFEAAVREAAQHYQVSLAPAFSLETGTAAGPASDGGDLQAYEHYQREGNTIAAKRVIEEAVDRMPDNSPEAAAYWRLRAALAARDQAWEPAWQALKHYLRLTHPEDAL